MRAFCAYSRVCAFRRSPGLAPAKHTAADDHVPAGFQPRSLDIFGDNDVAVRLHLESVQYVAVHNDIAVEIDIPGGIIHIAVTT